jgi:hypothetical protein
MRGTYKTRITIVCLGGLWILVAGSAGCQRRVSTAKMEPLLSLFGEPEKGCVFRTETSSDQGQVGVGCGVGDMPGLGICFQYMGNGFMPQGTADPSADQMQSCTFGAGGGAVVLPCCHMQDGDTQAKAFLRAANASNQITTALARKADDERRLRNECTANDDCQSHRCDIMQGKCSAALSHCLPRDAPCLAEKDCCAGHCSNQTRSCMDLPKY